MKRSLTCGLRQVTQQIISENGSPKCNDEGWACSASDVYSMYRKYFNNAKDCGTERGCFEQRYSGNYKFLSGRENLDNWNTNKNYSKLVMTDGVQILFSSYVIVQIKEISVSG